MSEMQQVGGVWLPAHEVHMVGWMQKRNQVVDGALTYQYGKLVEALARVRRWRTAVDIGAHCGTWAMHMAKRFDTLVCFEPVALHRECLARNLAGVHPHAAIDIHPCALGDVEGSVGIAVEPGSSGDSHVSGPGTVPQHRLDSYRLRNVDFIKVDCCGHELPALLGAEETILRCHPCISVEQKPARTRSAGHPRHGAIDFLLSLGARIRHAHGDVFVLTFRG